MRLAQTRSAAGRSKRLQFASTVLPLVLIILAVTWIVIPPQSDEIETVSRSAGLEPSVAIRQAVLASSPVQLRHENELVGESSLVGIRADSGCITLDMTIEPSSLPPATARERVAASE